MLSQTFRDFELILVNDGSTDSSADIMESYCKRDARVSCYHRPNSGVSSARNYGLEKACGKYVCFIDSDDYMYPDNLEVM